MHAPLLSLNMCHIVRFMIYFPLQVLSADKSNNSSRPTREGTQAPTICVHVQHPMILRLSHILIQKEVIFMSKRHKSISQIYHSFRTKQLMDTVTCRVVRVTKITGSSSDDWILLAPWLRVLLITLKYSAIFYTISSSPLHTQ
jgi:hypothetical protein